MDYLVLEEAEGYADLGMYEDALRVLGQLPEAARKEPRGLKVGLEICRQLGYWDTGAGLAWQILPIDRLEFREAAGRFHLARALHLESQGEEEAAAGALILLASVWPEGSTDLR